MNSQTDILFTEIKGKGGDVGLVTLNRPKTLNSLTAEMCILLDKKLIEWQQTERIKAVVICGAGERAFCAGGDLRSMYETGRNNLNLTESFFWHEYRLNHRIFNFTKPYIALLHSITMGGGAGVSIYGSPLSFLLQPIF